MSFIRPELAARIAPWREPLAASAAGLVGVWIATAGGWASVAGAAVVAVSAGWGLIALRRARFLQPASSPGIVEVDEGQIGYLAPVAGGFVALADLAELRLIEAGGARLWRLKTTDGQALLVPLGALGAERLFDAFAALPGLGPEALARAAAASETPVVVWRRTQALPARHHDLS